MRIWRRGINFLKAPCLSMDMEAQPKPSSIHNPRTTASYPDPLIVPPVSGNHIQTIIVLHGRGDQGRSFGAGLLRTKIPGFGDLQTTFPNAKFIFPTAAKRRARVLNNSTINQWFDLQSLVDPDAHIDIQYEGLRESTAYVCGLLRSAIDEVGPQNVILWGLSQGGAIMLTTLLHWDGEPFAAAVGMCTWLPMRSRMLEASNVGNGHAALSDDPFSPVGETVQDKGPLEMATACLREVLDGSAESETQHTVCRHIPIFLGHGILDEKVAVDLGRQACSFLELMGLDVRLKEYERLTHWYSGEMLRDIIHFLTERCEFAAP